MPSPSAPHGNTSTQPEPITNPNLSASLRADYEALQNDLQQARELASEFQRQLAGKSNDFADLKRVFEKTRNDLVRIEGSITALREERHRLANQAMQSIAFERKLTERDAEIARLRTEVENLNEQLARAGEASTAGTRGGNRRMFKWLR